nr:hypothetical protein ISGA_2253 [Gordonia sp. NB41Y]
MSTYGGPEILWWAGALGIYTGTVRMMVSAFGDTATLLITAVLAAVLSIHNASTRYVFDLSAGGALPRALGAVHGTHRSPHHRVVPSARPRPRRRPRVRTAGTSGCRGRHALLRPAQGDPYQAVDVSDPT